MGSTKVQAPPPRDYYNEATATVQAQIDMAPKILAAERQLVPQWQQLQYDQMMGQADNLKTFYRSVMGDSANLLTQYGNTFNTALAPIASGARTTYEAGLGGGAEVQNRLRSSALEDLNAGMGLTPEMERMGQQASRSAMAARGMINTNQGLASEVLNNYQLGLTRQDRARTFAGQVLAGDMNIANSAYQQYGQPIVQSGMAALSPMGLAGMATQYNQNLGPQYIQPESQYAANIYANNYNGILQARTASAQASGAMWGGLMQGVGTAVGGIYHGKG